MKNKISLNTYRLLDIGMFTFLIILFEFLAVLGTGINKIPMYSVTLFFTISLIVMMRWGLWSIVTIVAGAITYTYANKGTTENYFIYIIGDLFILIDLLWFLKDGKKKVKENIYYTILFVISGFFLVEIGRSIVAFIYGNDFFKVLISFLGTDSLSMLIGLLIICIARKQNGLFEDQVTYLKRINKEKEIDKSELETNENEEH